MNKFEELLDGGRHFSKLIGHFSHVALEINRTDEEMKADFISSGRTGQCGVVIQSGLNRVGAQYIPEGQTDEKIRYSIVANNKVNFLLENPSRINTFPQNDDERINHEARKIFGGGIKIVRSTKGILLIAISGFHPKIDEASSIVVGNEMIGLFNDASSSIARIQEYSIAFKNRYALAIACGANFIKTMTFDQAMEWGKNEIK